MMKVILGILRRLIGFIFFLPLFIISSFLDVFLFIFTGKDGNMKIMISYMNWVDKGIVKKNKEDNKYV